MGISIPRMVHCRFDEISLFVIVIGGGIAVSIGRFDENACSCPRSCSVVVVVEPSQIGRENVRVRVRVSLQLIGNKVRRVFVFAFVFGSKCSWNKDQDGGKIGRFKYRKYNLFEIIYNSISSYPSKYPSSPVRRGRSFVGKIGRFKYCKYNLIEIIYNSISSYPSKYPSSARS